MIFLSANIGEVVLAEALVNFRDGVPTSAVLLDAALLHVKADKILLLLSDFAEVVEVAPAIHIKGVLDDAQECSLACVGEVVINAWVVVLGIRDADSHLVRLLQVGERRLGRFDNGIDNQLGLNTAVAQTHRVSAAVSVDEPLTQVARHFYIYVVIAHNILRLKFTSAKIQRKSFHNTYKNYCLILVTMYVCKISKKFNK